MQQLSTIHNCPLNLRLRLIKKLKPFVQTTKLSYFMISFYGWLQWLVIRKFSLNPRKKEFGASLLGTKIFILLLDNCLQTCYVLFCCPSVVSLILLLFSKPNEKTSVWIAMKHLDKLQFYYQISGHLMQSPDNWNLFRSLWRFELSEVNCSYKFFMEMWFCLFILWIKNGKWQGLCSCGTGTKWNRDKVVT